MRVKDANVVSFPQLGIQCAKKKDVDDALKLRREINVDPYQSKYIDYSQTSFSSKKFY